MSDEMGEKQFEQLLNRSRNSLQREEAILHANAPTSIARAVAAYRAHSLLPEREPRWKESFRQMFQVPALLASAATAAAVLLVISAVSPRVVPDPAGTTGVSQPSLESIATFAEIVPASSEGEDEYAWTDEDMEIDLGSLYIPLELTEEDVETETIG
jgi:hypothetical protein